MRNKGLLSLSADGNTSIVGGWYDNSGYGAAWIWTRVGGTWTQQSTKLVGADAANPAGQGGSVSLSSGGNLAAIGGLGDSQHGFQLDGLSISTGATWVWRRS